MKYYVVECKHTPIKTIGYEVDYLVEVVEPPIIVAFDAPVESYFRIVNAFGQVRQVALGNFIKIYDQFPNTNPYIRPVAVFDRGITPYGDPTFIER